VIRHPAVAGRFYPADPRDLEARVRQFVAEAPSNQQEKSDGGKSCARNALACLVPHAGYVFSGGVAGAVYARLNFPRRIIILGPRHRPRGADFAINTGGAWETPLGRVEIDSELANLLVVVCPLLVNDEVAHRIEHSIEVQLPFLQVLAADFRFVPIAIGTLDFEMLTLLGHALAHVITGMGEPVLLIASSDMNHYEPDEITRAKDHLAIEQMLTLSAGGLYDTVRREKISMCGCGPAVAIITAALDLGATDAELVRYTTSSDVLGDREDVVGYAGMIFR
jgi:MEMO1 family protein